MMQTQEFKQSGHLNPELLDPRTMSLSADKLIGRWLNTDPRTDGISEIVIERKGERFWIRILGVGDNGPVVWPVAEAKPLANLEEEAGQRALALAATFEFGFMRGEAYFRVNKGVLVIVLFSVFLDGSGRSNYVNREFFFREL